MVVQLGNVPIPFCIRAMPDWTRTSYDVHGVPQRIRVETMHLQITADTEGKAMSRGYPREIGAWDRVIVERSYLFEEGKLYLQLSPGNPALDLGKGVSLCYHADTQLRPAFTALNISHGNHWLKWHIRVSLSGERHKISGTQAVRILPLAQDSRLPRPSTERPLSGCQRRAYWMRAPPEGEPPPRYELTEEQQKGSDRGGGVGRVL